MRPLAVEPRLRAHLDQVLALHRRDVAAGLGRVVLPFGLERKYPNAAVEWTWQFVFPASRICRDARWGPPSRYHLHESVLHGRLTTAGGLALYPGHAWGTVFQDVSYGSTAESLTALAPTDYKWSPETFDFDRDIPPREAEIGAILGRTNANPSDFASRGGKLIIAHGWADGIVSPYNTIDYFTAMQAEMGAGTVEDFARLYMAPGVGHCGGGVGPDHFDALELLQLWVEAGETPNRLIASKLGPDGHDDDPPIVSLSANRRVRRRRRSERRGQL